MEKITKEEFLRRLNRAEVAGIVLNNERKDEKLLQNIKEILIGDYYQKDGFECVVVSIHENHVEINCNEIRTIIN
jgi:hypothetical protein